MAKDEAEKAPKELKVSSDTEETAAEVPAETTISEQKHDIDQATEQPKKRRFTISRMGLVVMIVVLLNLTIAGASAYLWLHKSKAASPQPIATAPVQNIQAETKASELETPKTLHYKFETLGAEFDYPVDWRVEETNSQYAQGVQLSSPQFTLKQATGKTDQAQVILLIYGQYYSYAVFEDSIATQAPEQINYANPAPGQVPRTYASFFGYPIYKDGNPTNGIPSTFNAIVIGGSFNYQAGQRLKDKNYLKASPFVEMHVEVRSGFHQNPVLAELNKDIWNNNETLQQAKAVITSMRFN